MAGILDLVSAEDMMTPQVGKNPMQAFNDHIAFNEFLRDQVRTENLSREDYNILGGYDVANKVSPGNPVVGTLGNLFGGGAYNLIENFFSKTGTENSPFINDDGSSYNFRTNVTGQPLSEIPGTIFRNALGGSGLISQDLKQKYENLLAEYEGGLAKKTADSNLSKTLSDLVFTPAGAAEVQSKNPFNNMVSDTVLAEPRSQFQDYPGVENLGGVQNFDLKGVQDIISRMEEEKGNYIERPEDRFNMEGIMQNLKNYGLDTAGRYIGSQALGKAGAMTFGIPGAIVGTIGGLLGGGNLFNPNTYSQNAYNFSTPQGQKYIDTLYNPGGIMSGYNKVSAFGRGPLESITNRISKTSNPVIKQQLITAGKNITDSGQDTSKTGYNAVTQKGTYGYDDVNVGGSGTGGSGSKIVCTMMNESYGFGNFRNKIWLKHSKDLPKEYEIGYHTIFLPLVNFAKKEGKLNKLVKKTLEHIAKHRTIDLKQEMRGKKHLLGRIYRKVLEPICYLVGKIKNG